MGQNQVSESLCGAAGLGITYRTNDNLSYGEIRTNANPPSARAGSDITIRPGMLSTDSIGSIGPTVPVSNLCNTNGVYSGVQAYRILSRPSTTLTTGDRQQSNLSGTFLELINGNTIDIFSSNGLYFPSISDRNISSTNDID